MPYESPGALRTALEARLRNEARERGVEFDRLRRRALFERLLVRLEVTGPGIWVLKGGTALEVRWRERARTTKDLDLALRERPTDGEALHELLLAQLSEDPDGDGFRFDIGPPSVLPDDTAGRPAWRFAARSLLAGREFARVKVDVVARSEELVATERLMLPGALAFAGFPQRDVEAVAPAQHFAEKLHALTRRYPGRENTRVRDLVDLLMFIENGLPDPAEALKVARQVFATRATHELPERIPDPPAAWSDTYAMLAADLDVQAATTPEAMTRLNDFWVTVQATDKED
jgi:predicted nucleotidyltransferase component of viral defense system